MEIRIRTILLCFVSLCGCTKNIFWDDYPRSEMKVSGQVIANNNNSNELVSIWMDTFNQQTITDSTGNFSISISQSQTSTGSVNGPIKLYFYIQNYQLDSATFFLANGLFSKDQTDFLETGSMVETLFLEKILSANIQFDFNDTTFDLQDTLQILLNLDIHLDIEIETYLFNNKEPIFNSGLFFRNIVEPNTVFLYRHSEHDEYGNLINDHFEIQSYEMNEAVTWTYQLITDSLNFPDGDYEVFPYLFIRQDGIPTGMKNAMGGESVFIRSARFLNLPFDIVTDTLELKER